MNARVNQGYIITDSVHVSDTEFVIGANERAASPFVTWQCKDGDSYFWGHYCANRLSAVKDLCDRVETEVQYLENMQQELKARHKNKDYER